MVTVNGSPYKEKLDEIFARMKASVSERERLHPEDVAREKAEQLREEKQAEDERSIKIMQEGGFSEHHIKLIMEDQLDISNPIIIKTQIFGHEYNKITRPWMFMASRSGSGKTTSVHKLVFKMIKDRKIISPGYLVHSDFIEACFNRKAKVEDFYRYDLLVIDDFFKKAFESGSIREQDIIKKLIDYFYRFRKCLVICADVPIDDIHERLDKQEYADQICYRVLEKCGYNKDRRFVYGWNELTNMRK